jgi:hypothetical protein
MFGLQLKLDQFHPPVKPNFSLAHLSSRPFTLDQVSREKNSGRVLGIPCCDSHLCWAWGHSEHHFNVVTAETQLESDGNDSDSR